MLKKLMLTALAATPLLAAAPALAQNAAQNGVLIVYGNDKCPTNKDGEEIVVCQRMDESERYRDPLRNEKQVPLVQEYRARQDVESRVGATGIGSCSAVGPGGSTGCFVQQATQAKRERRVMKQEESALPLP